LGQYCWSGVSDGLFYGDKRESAELPRFEVGILPGKEDTLFSSAPTKGKACLPAEVDCVIFHAPCPDGFAAAFVAYLLLGDKCTYHGVSHSNKRAPQDADGRHAAILGFSFDEKTMDGILQR
jgi:hypothetical protein